MEQARGSDLWRKLERLGRARSEGVWAAIGVLLLIHGALAVGAVRWKSPTFDELAHLPAGYSYWKLNDYRLNPENGNLPQRWGALPLVAMGARLWSLESAAWKDSSVWTVAWEFLYRSGNDADHLFLAARTAMAVIGMALGILVAVWSWRLYGWMGAIVSLVLCAFNPPILANGPLVTSDVTTALFFLLASGVVWLLLHQLTMGRIVLAGGAVAGLCLSKMSAPLLGPMVVLMMAARLWRGQALVVDVAGWRRRVVGRWAVAGWLVGGLVAVGILAWLVIWAAYGFRYTAFSPAGGAGRLYPGWDWALEKGGLICTLVSWARDWRLLPEAYLFGFAHAMKMAGARSAFFNGEYSVYGWWGFFPYAFLVKTPLSMLMVLMLSGLVWVWRLEKCGSTGGWQVVRARLRESLYRTAPLWAILLVYWPAAVTSHINIGHRHILAVYPPLFVLAGSAARLWRMRRASLGAALAVCLILAVIEAALIYPHYLAYFNVFAGGPANAYRHLVDSSLDWGQDLPGLARWLEDHGLDRAGAPVYLCYFGTASVRHYGIQATLLPGYMDQSEPWSLPELKPGVYCISATMLQGVYIPHTPGPRWRVEYERLYRELLKAVLEFIQADGPRRLQLMEERGEEYWARVIGTFRWVRLARLCAYLRERQPDDQVGYSILIYRLTAEELDAALNVPADG